MNDQIKANIDGQKEIVLNGEEIEKCKLIEVETNRFHMILDDLGYSLEILEADYIHRKYRVRINHRIHTVTLGRPLEMRLREQLSGIVMDEKHTDVRAPMPGLVLDLLVSEGQEVEEGDTLLVLEAMKMENILKAPSPGTIQSVRISSGETVDKGQILIEIN